MSVLGPGLRVLRSLTRGYYLPPAARLVGEVVSVDALRERLVYGYARSNR